MTYPLSLLQSPLSYYLYCDSCYALLLRSIIPLFHILFYDSPLSLICHPIPIMTNPPHSICHVVGLHSCFNTALYSFQHSFTNLFSFIRHAFSTMLRCFMTHLESLFCI